MRGFLVRLTDEQRDRLEAYRAAHGLRSGSEAIRHMIDGVIHYDHHMKPPERRGELTPKPAPMAPKTALGESVPSKHWSNLKKGK